MDLTKEYPRSPRERIGGYVHLARMIDKARAKACGTLGEYIYPCPLDESLLSFLGIDAETFLQAVKDRDDPQVLAWLDRNTKRPGDEAVEKWNRAFLDRKPQDRGSMEHFIKLRDKVAPNRTDITTWVDLLDLEEGRCP